MWLARDRRAGVTTLAAIALPALLGFGALAVDMGSVYTASRRLQGMADAAALAAATDIANADDLARASVIAAQWNGSVTTASVTGSWRADRPAQTRFVPGNGAGSPAARVTLSADTPLFLGTIFGAKRLSLSRTATATAQPMAAFSIGTRLASLDGGVANALLSALTGSEISLDAMDYRALASADVDLFAFSDALRTRLHMDAATYDEVLAADVSTGDALGALGDVLAASGAREASAAVRRIAQAAGTGDIELSRLIDLGDAGARDVAPQGRLARVDAGQLLNALLVAANGDRQLALDLVSSVPGVAQTRAWIAIGDRPARSPWLTVTADGNPIIRSAQTRIYVEATIGVPGIAQVRLPLLVELAEGEARLASLGCASVAARSVAIDARPSPANLHIAEVDRSRLGDHRAKILAGPARLLTLPLVTASGEAHVATGGASGWQRLSFSQSDIDNGTIKTVRTGDVTQSLVASMIRDLNVQVRVLGLLPISAGAIGSAIGNQLAVAAPALDGLIVSLTQQLGIGIGEADIRVSGLRCGQPVLVA